MGDIPRKIFITCEQKIEYKLSVRGRSSDWESARLKTELSRVQISATPLEIVSFILH
jgi:hypothetical protein